MLELSHRVGFIIGTDAPDSSVVTMPYWHRCPTVVLTPSRFESLSMHPSFQLDAPWGCSWRKCLPRASCPLYSETQNTRCRRASRSLLLTSSIFILLWFHRPRTLKSVHGGEPISQSGLSSSQVRAANSRCSFRLKFQHPPSGWAVEKSNSFSPEIPRAGRR